MDNIITEENDVLPFGSHPILTQGGFASLAILTRKYLKKPDSKKQNLASEEGDEKR